MAFFSASRFSAVFVPLPETCLSGEVYFGITDFSIVKFEFLLYWIVFTGDLTLLLSPFLFYDLLRSLLACAPEAPDLAGYGVFTYVTFTLVFCLFNVPLN